MSGGGGEEDSEEDLIQVVVLDCEGNRIIEEQQRGSSNEWKTIQIDRSQLGEGFRSAPVGNIAVQQLVDQPGSFVVVLYDEVETEKAAWNRMSVIALIDCYKKNKTRIEFGNEKKKIIWEEIANDVYATTGQRFTCLQVQSKWKQMEKKFREVVEHNSINGNAKKSYIYFKELLEVYKPSLKMDGVEETELPSEESGSGEISKEDKKIRNIRLSLMEENDTEDHDKSSVVVSKWNQKSILLLIRCYKNNYAKFKSSKHQNKKFWEEIANVMEYELDQKFTWSQVEAKWKFLTNRYKDVLEHSSVSGNFKKTCTFFTELHEIYKNDTDFKLEDTEFCHDEDISMESEDEIQVGSNASHDKVATETFPFRRGVKFKWNSDSVLALINCYERKKSKFRNSFHKKKNIWQEIAKAIHSETGQLFTWFQVEAKWKNITKKFRDVVDHNCRPGNAKRTCSYFSELQRVYRYHPCENPASKAAEEDNAEGQDEVVVEKETDLAAGLKPRRVVDPSTRDPLLGFLRKMHSDNRALAVKQMALQKAMHEEKMAAFGQLIDILKTAFCK